MAGRTATRVGLTTGERRTGADVAAAMPPLDQPVLLRVVGTAVMERDTGRDGRLVFARATAGVIVRVGGAPVGVVARGVGVASMRVVPCDVGRVVAIARYDTAVRAAGTGVVVIEGLLGSAVAASAGTAGVVAAVGAKDATAVAVPAAPPLPVATDVATAGAVMAPSLIVVTVGVTVSTLARRAADDTVPVAPPLEVLVTPPLGATVAEAGASCAGTVTLPVTPNAGTAVDVPFVAPTVPMAPGPLPPRLPRATRPVAGVAVGWDNATAARAVAEEAAARTVTAERVGVV